MSRQTVTNALRHPERVRPETLSRVQAEIVRLGYRPSSAAQSLQAQRAGAIGVELNALGADYHNAVMAPFVAALTLAAPAHAFHIVTFGSQHHTPTLEGYQQMWRGRVVDAFVLADTHAGRSTTGVAARPGHPVLLLRADLGRPWVPSLGRRRRAPRHRARRRPLPRGGLRHRRLPGLPVRCLGRGRRPPRGLAGRLPGRRSRAWPRRLRSRRARLRPLRWQTWSSAPSGWVARSSAPPTCWPSVPCTPSGAPDCGPASTSAWSASTTPSWLGCTA